MHRKFSCGFSAGLSCVSYARRAIFWLFERSSVVACRPPQEPKNELPLPLPLPLPVLEDVENRPTPPLLSSCWYVGLPPFAVVDASLLFLLGRATAVAQKKIDDARGTWGHSDFRT